MVDYTDVATLDELLASLQQYDELVGTALDIIFVPSPNIESMHAFYYGLLTGNINDIDIYLDNVWHNHVLFPALYAADAYATALCIIYQLIQSDAIRNGTVAKEISYIEFDYARKTLENMEYLIRYWFDRWAAELNDEKMQGAASILEALLLYNYNLIDLLSYCHPFSYYDENYRNIAIMAGDGWAAD